MLHGTLYINNYQYISYTFLYIEKLNNQEPGKELFGFVIKRSRINCDRTFDCCEHK